MRLNIAVFDLQILELFIVRFLVGRDARHRVELDVAVVRAGFPFNQVVVHSRSCRIFNIGKGGIQALHIVVILCTNIGRKFQLGFPVYHDTVDVFGHTDGHAIEQANRVQPFLRDSAGQNLKGGILFNRQLSGEQIDGNAAAELDLLQVTALIVDKLVVTHVGYDFVFLNSGDIAVLIRIDQGPIGKLVEIQILCRNIGDQITLQHIQTVDLIVSAQFDRVGSAHIIQRAGDGDSNGGRSLHPVDVFALLQFQIDIALAGMDTAQINVDIIAGSNGCFGNRVYPANHHAGDIHVDIAAGAYVNRTGFVSAVNFVREYPGTERSIATANTGSTAYNQLMYPQGADIAGGSLDHLGGQHAACLPCPTDIGSAIVDRNQAGEAYVACAGAGHIKRRQILGMLRLLCRAAAIDKYLGINKPGIDIGHGLEDQAHICAVGNRQGGNHGLIVNLDAGDCAIQVGVAGQIVHDIADDVVGAGRIPDFRLIADADCTDTASFGDINIHTCSRITQIQGNVCDGCTAAGMEAGFRIIRMLADKAAGVLLVQNTGRREMAIINSEIRALVGQVGNRNRGSFTGDNLALGIGITNRVQLNTGIGVDIGIQIVRRRGSIDDRAVMTDHRDTDNTDTGIQIGIQIIHRVNIRA